jgi:hypothetical protein
MFCVYFTRWVFGIDQIINLQKDILTEHKNINSKNKNIEHFDDDDELVEMNKQLKKSLKKITTL